MQVSILALAMAMAKSLALTWLLAVFALFVNIFWTGALRRKLTYFNCSRRSTHTYVLYMLVYSRTDLCPYLCCSCHIHSSFCASCLLHIPSLSFLLLPINCNQFRCQHTLQITAGYLFMPCLEAPHSPLQLNNYLMTHYHYYYYYQCHCPTTSYHFHISLRPYKSGN